VKQAGMGPRDWDWRAPAGAAAICMSAGPPTRRWAVFLPGTLLLAAFWRTEQPQRPAAAAVLRLAPP